MNTTALNSDLRGTRSAVTHMGALFAPEAGSLKDFYFRDLCKRIFALDQQYIFISEYQARGKRVFHLMREFHDIEMLYAINKIEGMFPVEHHAVTAVADQLRRSGHDIHELWYKTFGGFVIREPRTPVLIYKRGQASDDTDIFYGRGYIKGIAWKGQSTHVAELLRVPRQLNTHEARNDKAEYAKLLRSTLHRGEPLRFFESDGYRFEEAPRVVKQTDR